MLNLTIVEKLVEQCNALVLAPKPESWHKVKRIAFTQEMWDSIDSDWWDRVEAIEHIPEAHAQRVRDEAPGYWKQQREEWSNEFQKELLVFKRDDERYWMYPLAEIANLVAMLDSWVKRGIGDPEIRYEGQILEMARKREELQQKTCRIEREVQGNFTEELYAHNAQDRVNEEEIEKFIRRIHQEAQQELKERRETLTRYKQCLSWMRSRDRTLERIRSKAAKELKEIEEKQEREYQRLCAVAEKEQVRSEDPPFS
jgi:hypothetical protein